jgi:hypothetical protein
MKIWVTHWGMTETNQIWSWVARAPNGFKAMMVWDNDWIDESTVKLLRPDWSPQSPGGPKLRHALQQLYQQGQSIFVVRSTQPPAQHENGRSIGRQFDHDWILESRITRIDDHSYNGTVTNNILHREWLQIISHN